MGTKSKDKFYFSHDSNARRDPKLIALRSKHGWAGYGRFFAFIEMLREEKEYQIEIEKSYVLTSVSSELSFNSPDECKEFINDCLNFDLLETDGIFVWSNSLNERMAIFEAKRKRYSDMAKKRWGDREKKTETNDSKESKDAKEKSEKKTAHYKSVESLRNDSLFAEVILSEIKKKPEFSVLNENQIQKERRKCIDWLASKGKRQSNYRAFFFNWLRTHIEKNELDKGSNKDKAMVY